MPLLSNGEFVDDPFVTLDDGTELSDEGDIIVSWDRLTQDGDSLKARPGKLGVVFPVTEDPQALAPHLGALSVIALPFAAFADGRAYSLARILRSQLGYAGELRAIGDILPDQIAFMRQVGFDTFLPNSDRHSLDAWQSAATTMTVTYQSGYVPERGFSPQEIFEQRRLARQ